MKKFIKSYSFSDFVEDSWPRWKFLALHDALLASTKLQLELIKENDDASSYAYAGNVSSMPILWDADDYKFLSQFELDDWSKMLSWRYNEGLMQAAEQREQHPEKSIGDIPDREKMIKVGRGTNINDTKNGWREYYDVWTGLKELMLKLEKPHKERADHKPTSRYPKSMGELKDGPGLQDIDPWETDENSPKHPKHYFNAGGGVYNYDLSDPARVTDADIDRIPDNEIEIPKNTPNNPEAIAAAIKKKKDDMKKNRHHTFAGFSVLQGGPTVSKHIHNWRKAQGLGLLAPVGDTYKDPFTGEDLPVTHVSGEGKNMPKTKGGGDAKQGFWTTHSGQADEADDQGVVKQKGGALKMPVVYRKLNYKEFDAKGKEKPQKTEPTAMPVLTPAKTLPRIPTNGEFALTMKQREEFAKRRGWWPKKAAEGCPDPSGGSSLYQPGMSYADLAGVCSTALNAGAPGDLTFLLSNIDVLDPKQIDHLKKGRRDALHLAAAKFGNHLCPDCKGKKTDLSGNLCANCKGTGRDSWAIINSNKKGDDDSIAEGGYYAIGHTPNKGNKSFGASDILPEQLGAAFQKWKKELKFEALTATNRWINWATQYGIPEPIITMVKAAVAQEQGGLIDVLAIYLGLELNNWQMGIYDPSVGLTHVQKSRKEAYALESEDPNEIANALTGVELPKTHQSFMKNEDDTKYQKSNAYAPSHWLSSVPGGSGSGPKEMTLNQESAKKIADKLVSQKDNKFFEEKILTFPISWIMGVLEEKGLAKQLEPDQPVDGEGDPDDKGRDSKKDIQSSKTRTEWRINKASNMVWTFSQRGYGNFDMSRRERERRPDKMKLMYTGAETGEQAKKTGGLEAHSKKGYSIQADDLAPMLKGWITRRGQLKPDSQEIMTRQQLVPTIKGMTDWLRTFRQDVKGKFGQQVDQEADAAAGNVEQAVEAEAQRQEQDPTISMEKSQFQQDWDTFWGEFLEEIIGGDKSGIPLDHEIEFKDEEGKPNEHEVQFGPPMDLMGFVNIAAQIGHPVNDAAGVVDIIKTLWSDKGASQYAVPFFIAFCKKKGIPMDDNTAIEQVKAAGGNPVQKSTTTAAAPQGSVQMPQQAQKPAMAATDLSGLLAQLPSKPELWKELEGRYAELQSPELQQAVATATQAIKAQFKQKHATKQPMSADEAKAYQLVNSLSR